MRFNSIFITIILTFSGYSQTKWTHKNPFEKKNFIENKGQFFRIDKLLVEEILYSANIDGIHYYFTKKGYIVQRHIKQENSEEEIESAKIKPGIKEEKSDGLSENELKYKTAEQLHVLQWQNSNPNVEIVPEDMVDNYYTYPDRK